MPNIPSFDDVKSLMAFDFGTQKFGIAIGQTLIESSTPLPLFPVQDGIPDWEKLHQIIQQWQPDLFLVGLPLNMDDTESELSLRARKFARRLRHQTNIATYMIDERLSSREARQQLQYYQAKGQKKRVNVDSLVASILIETWYYDPSQVIEP